MAIKPRMGNHVPDNFALLTLDEVYDPPLRGFRTAVAGNVAVVKLNGDVVIIPGLLAGETFRGMIQQINTDNTTVTTPETNIVVFW